MTEKGISTVVLAPAAEVLVQVKLGGTVAELDVGQPLGDDAEKSGIQANGSADNGDDNPALRRIVGFPDPLSPVGLAGAVETGLPFPPRLSPQLFPGSILYPVCPVLVHHFGSRRYVTPCIPMVVKSWDARGDVSHRTEWQREEGYGQFQPHSA
jgi:hypothetical protein